MKLTRKLSHFDMLVIAMLMGLALLTGLMVWWSYQAGVQIVATYPPDGGRDISTLTTIDLTFDHPMLTIDNPIRLTPPVAGESMWQGKQLRFIPAEPLQPETTYTVEVADTLQSETDLTVQADLTWQFTTRSPHILYVAMDETEYDQLYQLEPQSRDGRALTTEPHGIYDYALSPDGRYVVYSAWNEDSGRDLWRLEFASAQKQLLLACQDSVCNGAAWSPDGSRMVYERRNIPIPGGAPGPPRLWWLEPTTRETVPVFSDKQILGYGAGWSADGRWLSYVSPENQGVQLYNLETEASLLIPSRTGATAVWHPSEVLLITSDIQASDEGFASHLFRVEPEQGNIINLSESANQVEDSSPVWSPDGQWLLFTRKVAGTAMGKQLWLMLPDGSQADYLTNEPTFHHSFPAWSPDGQIIVYQQFALKELGSQPSLWWLSRATQRAEPLVSHGTQPAWLP